MNTIKVLDVDSLCNPTLIRARVTNISPIKIQSEYPGVYIFSKDATVCDTKLELKEIGTHEFKISTQVRDLGKFSSKAELEEYLQNTFLKKISDFPHDYEDIGKYYSKLTYLDQMSEGSGLLFSESGKMKAMTLEPNFQVSGEEICDLDKILLFMGQEVIYTNWKTKESQKFDLNDYGLEVDPKLEYLKKYLKIDMYYSDFPEYKTPLDPLTTFKKIEGMHCEFNASVETENGLRLPYCVTVEDRGNKSFYVKINLHENVKPVQRIRAIIAECPGPNIRYDEDVAYEIEDVSDPEKKYTIPADGQFVDVVAGIYKYVNCSPTQTYMRCKKFSEDILPLVFNEVATLVHVIKHEDEDPVEEAPPIVEDYVKENIIYLNDSVVKYNGTMEFPKNCNYDKWIVDGLQSTFDNKEKIVSLVGRKLTSTNNVYIENFIDSLQSLRRMVQERANGKVYLVVDVKPLAYNHQIIKDYFIKNETPLVDGLIFRVWDKDTFKSIFITNRYLSNIEVCYWVDDGSLLKDIDTYLYENSKRYTRFKTRDDNTTYSRDLKSRIVLVNGRDNRRSGYAGVARDFCKYHTSIQEDDLDSALIFSSGDGSKLERWGDIENQSIKDFILEDNDNCCDQISICFESRKRKRSFKSQEYKMAKLKKLSPCSLKY